MKCTESLSLSCSHSEGKAIRIKRWCRVMILMNLPRDRTERVKSLICHKGFHIALSGTIGDSTLLYDRVHGTVATSDYAKNFIVFNQNKTKLKKLFSYFLSFWLDQFIVLELVLRSCSVLQKIF